MTNKQWNQLQRLKMQRLEKALLHPFSLEQALQEFFYLNF